MTGGFAYVLDLDRSFADKCNYELVEIMRISTESYESYRNHLRSIISEFVTHTGSAWGQELADNFHDYVRKFWLVKPKAASLKSLLESVQASPE